MFPRMKSIVGRKIVNYLEHIARRQHIYKYSVRGCTIRLKVESEIEKFRARTYATKEPETLEWIERYFQPGDVIYDIGANIGLYSLFAAKHLCGQCKVYAFEPEALNHARLSENIYLNGLSGVVLPCCIAVTDRLCFDTFYLNPDNFEKMAAAQGLVSASALHSFGVAEDYTGRSFPPFHKQGTVGVSLDYLWQAWGLDFPNHVKIDVDGLEDKVIAGAAQTLKDQRLRSVLVEVSGSRASSDPILQRLIQAGFTQVIGFAAHYGDSVSSNCVFIREL